MIHTRRDFIKATGTAAMSFALPKAAVARQPDAREKKHLVTLSFDDGFKKSFARTAEIYEKHKLSACLNVFSQELKGFDPKQAVFNFPYNASTPELVKWLPTQVKALRTGGGAINSLPHKGQVKLTCTSFGPGNCEKAIDSVDVLPASRALVKYQGG